MGEDDGTFGQGQWLVALKGTQPGDRFAIAEAAGRGLVAVVDFASTSQPVGSRFYAWGVVSYLSPPLGFDELRAQQVFEPRRGTDWRWLRGRPKHLTDGEADRIVALASGWPAVDLPARGPRARDGFEIWPMTGGLPPERALQDAIATSRKLWKAIGFKERPEVEQRISSSDRSDLLGDGVVCEVKNRIGHSWGPQQVERYLATLDRDRPEHAPWRGVLVHNEPTLAPAAAQRLANSPYADRIRVFGIEAASRRDGRWRRPIVLFESSAAPARGRGAKR